MLLWTFEGGNLVSLKVVETAQQYRAYRVWDWPESYLARNGEEKPSLIIIQKGDGQYDKDPLALVRRLRRWAGASLEGTLKELERFRLKLATLERIEAELTAKGAGDGPAAGVPE